MLTALEQIGIDGGAGTDRVAIIGVGQVDSNPEVIANILNITLEGIDELGLFDTLGALFETLPDPMGAAAEWGLLPDAWASLG